MGNNGSKNQALRSGPVTDPSNVTDGTTSSSARPFAHTTRKREEDEAIGVAASEDEAFVVSCDHTHFPINTTATTASMPSPTTPLNQAVTLGQLLVPVEETQENTNSRPTNGSTGHPRNTYTIESRISISSDTTELSDSSTPPLSNTNSLRKIYRAAKQNINLPVTLMDHASHNTSYLQYLTVDITSSPHSPKPSYVTGLHINKLYKPFN